MTTSQHFIPASLMLRRVGTNGNTDALLFQELLYAGEFFTKITVGALIAALQEDPDNSRYRLEHGLVRANGLGEWVTSLHSIFSSNDPARLPPACYEIRNTFTQKVDSEHWQYDAVSPFQDVLKLLSEPPTSGDPRVPTKLPLLSWFTAFVEVRNKTRGHGAITPSKAALAVGHLRRAIDVLVTNNPLFSLPWAFLHRNLSGEHTVVPVGGDTTCFVDFDGLALGSTATYPDGLYIWIEEPRPVRLVHTDMSVEDFFVPNGAFTGDAFELHSPITDNRKRGDAAEYRGDPSPHPESETSGGKELDFVGSALSNLPSSRPNYVHRPDLEKKLSRALLDDRHPVITLRGSGGTGKTSLALAVLHEIADQNRYDYILWFSARDIDLTTSGPKRVAPDVLTLQQIASEYFRLMEETPGDPQSAMAGHLRHSPDGPMLFVFDNFETLSRSMDVYEWLNSNVRPPNAILITSRFRRGFESDLPIPVYGMEFEEARQLMLDRADALQIREQLRDSDIRTVFGQSKGHPYVIKLILGAMATQRTLGGNIVRLADSDAVLDALFQRTFDELTPTARLIFMALCAWRSLVSRYVMEATIRVFFRDASDPEGAIDELLRMSLCEKQEAADGIDFLEVPTIAALFGRKKLRVNPDMNLIEHAVDFIRESGPAKSTDMKNAGFPRIEALFAGTARRIRAKEMGLNQGREILAFLCARTPHAWLTFADVESEFDVHREVTCVSRYVEAFPDTRLAKDGWLRLCGLYRRLHDPLASCNAYLRAAEHEAPTLESVSSMANYMNGHIGHMRQMDRNQRGALLRPLAKLFEPHIEEASATDLSRVAWLYLNCGEEKAADRYTALGLRKDPGNQHCRSLLNRRSASRT